MLNLAVFSTYSNYFLALRKNKWVAICVRLAPEIGFSRHDRAKRMVLLADDFKVQLQNLGKT
jgi:hypothetical protein